MRKFTAKNRLHWEDYAARNLPRKSVSSRKVCRRRERLGCLSFLSAFASICLMRSRVTLKSAPTSSKVLGVPSSRPKRNVKMLRSRSVKPSMACSSSSLSIEKTVALAGETAFLSSMKSPNEVSPSSPIGVCIEIGCCDTLRMSFIFETGSRSSLESSSGVGSRPFSWIKRRALT